MPAPPGLEITAHAKVNLSLSVHGLLPDGRHQVSTVLQAISLADVLAVERGESSSLEVEGDAPAGEDNLVLRAQRELEAAAARSLPAHFRLRKAIPPGAGLGGGSSDAAAALRGLKAIYELRLDLLPVAAAVGADVPFFLHGGSAEATGAGADLRPAPPAEGWFAVAWPGYPVSTPAVYSAWDRVGGAGPNQLASAAFEVEPRLREFADRLGPAWQMTGSGSAFFKQLPTEVEAQAAVAGLDCWTAVAAPVGPWD